MNTAVSIAGFPKSALEIHFEERIHSWFQKPGLNTSHSNFASIPVALFLAALARHRPVTLLLRMSRKYVDTYPSPIAVSRAAIVPSSGSTDEYSVARYPDIKDPLATDRTYPTQW